MLPLKTAILREIKIHNKTVQRETLLNMKDNRTKFVIAMVAISVVSLSFLKKRECDNLIYYREYGLMLNSTSEKTRIKSGASISVKLSGDSVIKATLFDCYGRATLKLYRNRKLIIESNFGNNEISFETLNAYSRICRCYKDYSLANITPIKDGIWKYYDTSGKVWMEQHWENDSLIKIRK